MIGVFVLLLWLALFVMIIWMQVRILRRTGLNGWWILLLFVPWLNLITAWIFALVKWPNVRKKGATG